MTRRRRWPECGARAVGSGRGASLPMTAVRRQVFPAYPSRQARCAAQPLASRTNRCVTTWSGAWRIPVPRFGEVGSPMCPGDMASRERGRGRPPGSSREEHAPTCPRAAGGPPPISAAEHASERSKEPVQRASRAAVGGGDGGYRCRAFHCSPQTRSGELRAETDDGWRSRYVPRTPAFATTCPPDLVALQSRPTIPLIVGKKPEEPTRVRRRYRP